MGMSPRKGYALVDVSHRSPLEPLSLSNSRSCSLSHLAVPLILTWQPLSASVSSGSLWNIAARYQRDP